MNHKKELLWGLWVSSSSLRKRRREPSEAVDFARNLLGMLTRYASGPNSLAL